MFVSGWQHQYFSVGTMSVGQGKELMVGTMLELLEF